MPAGRFKGAGWAPAGRRRQRGLWGPSREGTASPGAKRPPGPLLPPGNGKIILKCSCCPQLAFPSFQETREYEVSI